MSNSVTLWTVAHQAPLSMGILQARVLEWVAMPSFRESSQLKDWTWVFCIVSRFFNAEPPGKPIINADLPSNGSDIFAFRKREQWSCKFVLGIIAIFWTFKIKSKLRVSKNIFQLMEYCLKGNSSRVILNEMLDVKSRHLDVSLSTWIQVQNSGLQVYLAFIALLHPLLVVKLQSFVCSALLTPTLYQLNKLPLSCIALAWNGSPWKQQKRGWERRSSANFPRLWLGWTKVSPGALINNNHIRKSKRNWATMLLENERGERTSVHVWTDSKIYGNESLGGDEFPFNAVTSVVLRFNLWFLAVKPTLFLQTWHQMLPGRYSWSDKNLFNRFSEANTN